MLSQSYKQLLRQTNKSPTFLPERSKKQTRPSRCANSTSEVVFTGSEIEKIISELRLTASYTQTQTSKKENRPTSFLALSRARINSTTALFSFTSFTRKPVNAFSFPDGEGFPTEKVLLQTAETLLFTPMMKEMKAKCTNHQRSVTHEKSNSSRGQHPPTCAKRAALWSVLIVEMSMYEEDVSF